MIKRLTLPRNNGIKTGYWSPRNKPELIEALAAYEDTGLSPQEILALKAEHALQVIREVEEHEKED